MKNPPSLDWLDGFVESTSFALDSSISCRVNHTANPLVYNVELTFGEELSGERMLMVWNIFQKWAARNGAQPISRVARDAKCAVVSLAVKSRSGIPKNDHPAG